MEPELNGAVLVAAYHNNFVPPNAGRGRGPKIELTDVIGMADEERETYLAGKAPMWLMMFTNWPTAKIFPQQTTTPQPE